MPKKVNSTVSGKILYVWASLRIALGFVFLWAFVDKLFGLGFATCRNPTTEAVVLGCEKAWIAGGSPTTGFLKFATQGPLEGFFRGLAGIALIDWLFMGALLLLGVALVLGVGVRLAAIGGSILMLSMWLALLPPENNPLIDEHIIYIGVLIGLALVNDDQRFGLGAWWARKSLIQKFPILR